MSLLLEQVYFRIKMTKEVKPSLSNEVQSVNFGHGLKYAKNC
jgi:hypothetical protein